MKDLLVVLPSRARPHNMKRLWEAMQETCRGDTTLLAGLDESDETRSGYPDGPQYIVRNDLQRNVTGWINVLAVPRARQYRAIGHFGDDCVPRTTGWDVTFMEALEKTPFAFGNDLEISQRRPGSLPTHIFMRSKVVQKLGYMGPPSIRHMYVDLSWLAWGEAAGITYLHDVIIEHMHFLEGKAPVDASYQLSRQGINEGLAALQKYVAAKLDRDIRKLCPHPEFGSGEFYNMCWGKGLGIPKP